MAIIADVHMHSSFSFDSDTPMEQQIQSAIEKGLEHICITEHMDLDTPYANVPEEEKALFQFEYEEYRKAYLPLKEKYKDQIQVHFGVEMGLNVRLKDEIEAYVASHPEYEFVIGSTHSDFENDPYLPSYFAERTAQEAVRHWMETTLNNVRTFSFFDTCAHLDYIERYCIQHEPASLFEQLAKEGKTYGTYCYEQNRETIDEILKTLIEKDKCLEMNTSAAFKSKGKEGPAVHREPNPCPAILRRYRQLGGTKITIGADAHVPEQVGGCFEEAEKILKEAGFDGYYVFTDRKGEKHFF